MQKNKKSGRGPTLFHTTVYIYIYIYNIYIKLFVVIKILLMYN